MYRIRLSALLAALAAAVTLTACGGDPVSTDTTAVTTEAVTTAPEPASLDLVKDGKTAFTIIRSDFIEDEDTISQMKKIMNAFEKNTGVRISLGTDWVKPGQEPNAETYEILIGQTNHPETEEVLRSLKYRDYAVKMVGNKIVIAGHTADARMSAVNHFVNQVLAKAEPNKDFAFTEADNFVHQGEYSLADFNLGNTSISEYTIVVPKGSAYVAEDFARRLQTVIATRSGYYLPIAEETDGKAIAIRVDDNVNTWNATLSGDTLTCTAGGMWGFDLMYDAIHDILYDAKSNLTLENNWTLSGDIAKAGDEEINRSLTIDGDIRIMYHNIWSIGDALNRDDMEAALFLAYMPDALGMQEVNAKMRNSDLFKLLAKEYTEVPAKATNQSGVNYVPIVYRAERLELIDYGWHLYNDKAGDQSKSVTWAIFKDKKTGKQFGMANTHFYWTSDALGQSARLIDAAEILQVVSDVQAKYPVTFVIGGDLNCRVSSEPQLNLMKGGWKNAHNTASVYKTNTKGHHAYATLDPVTNLYVNGPLPSGGYDTAIDHIYISGTDFEVRVFNTLLHRYSLDSSDHCPIYVDLKFKD